MESSTSCTSATATRTSRFWSDALRLKFHRQVAELHQRTEMPVEERHYRGLALTTSNEHEHPNLLPFDHELQLADNIAFLAHWKEGVSRVSAVTLQEHPGPPGRLVVLLSSNSTPSDSVIGGLEKIGRSISLYAAHRKNRQAFNQRLFEEVLELSQERILERIRPPWLPQPSYVTRKRPFLRDTARTLSQRFRKHQRGGPQMHDLTVKAEELVESLTVLERPPAATGGTAATESIENVVLKAAALARMGSNSSLEKSLESIGADSMLSRDSRAVVRQIDKIARYLFVCSDFLRIARCPESRHLFENITIRRLQSMPGCVPPGARKHCFVHAEIQQVFYYELEGSSHEPPPRAIGSSKSACYLCDLFIQKQRRYQMSHCHGRLYDQWTLPDALEVTGPAAANIHSIVQSMVAEMAARCRGHQRSSTWTPFPMESRAFLPLPGGSTSSKATSVPSALGSHHMQNSQDGSSASQKTSRLSRASPELPVRRINISSEALPPARLDLQSGRERLEIGIDDELSLHVDFDCASAGSLCVTRTARPPESLRAVTNVLDIPTGAEVDAACSQNPAHTSLCLRHGGLFVILDIYWGRS